MIDKDVLFNFEVMNTPITLKDLLIGLAIGFLMALVSSTFNSEDTSVFTENKTTKMEGRIEKLESQIATLQGEKETYKRWLDSTITILNTEQRLDLMKKM